MSVEEIINDKIKLEGGFVNRRDDRGGATKYGISIGTLSEWRGRRVTVQEVKALSVEEAKHILKKLYIENPGFTRIKDEIVLEQLFDVAVHFNQSIAAQLLQGIAGVKVDGHFGKESAAAVDKLPLSLVIFELTARKLEVYAASVSSNPNNAAGFLNRSAAMLEAYAARSPDDAAFAKELAAKLRKYAGDKRVRQSAPAWFRAIAKQARQYAQKFKRRKRLSPSLLDPNIPGGGGGGSAGARPRSWDHVLGWRGEASEQMTEDSPGLVWAKSSWTSRFTFDLARVSPFIWKGSVGSSVAGESTEGTHGEPGKPFTRTSSGNDSQKVTLSYSPGAKTWSFDAPKFRYVFNQVEPGDTMASWYKHSSGHGQATLAGIAELLPKDPPSDYSISVEVSTPHHYEETTERTTISIHLTPTSVADAGLQSEEHAPGPPPEAPPSSVAEGPRPASNASGRRGERRMEQRVERDESPTSAAGNGPATSDDAVPPAVETVFWLEAEDTAHLTPECPALRAGGSEPVAEAVPFTEDLQALSASLGVPVCGTCKRMIIAGARMVRRIKTTEGVIEFCRDRLRVARAPGIFHSAQLLELPFWRVNIWRAKGGDGRFSTRPRVVLGYDVLLPGDVIAKQEVVLPFEDAAQRDECVAELARAFEID